MGDFLLQGEVAELRDQLADQHKATLRFLGYMRDRLPENTAWDLFAAAGAPLAVGLMEVLFRGPAPLSHEAVTDEVAAFAARFADKLLVERTKREAAALEAKKTRTDKQ